MLIIGDEDNLIVFRRKVLDIHLIKDGGLTKKIEIQRAKSGPDLNVDLISQEWVGLDVQCKYTPIYLGGTKRILNSKKDESDQRHQQTQAEETIHRPVLNEDREECSHRCVNKAICGHECCKHGVVKKRTPMKSLVKTPLINKSRFMDNYITDLKKKILPMPDTPRIGTTNRSVPPAFSTVDLTKFAYTPNGDRLQSWRDREKNNMRTPGSGQSCRYGTPQDKSNSQFQDSSWVKLNLFMRDRDQTAEAVEGPDNPDMYSDHEYYNGEEEEDNIWEEDDLGEFELQSNVVPAPQSTSSNRYQSSGSRDTNTTLNYNRDYNQEDESSSLPSLVRRHQSKPQNHRYGKVVAWSNSQELVDGNDDSWSGSDNELISADQELSQEQASNVHVLKINNGNIQNTGGSYSNNQKNLASFQTLKVGSSSFGKNATGFSQSRPEIEKSSVNRQSKFKFTSAKRTDKGSLSNNWVKSNIQKPKEIGSASLQNRQHPCKSFPENSSSSDSFIKKGLYQEKEPLATINEQNQLNTRQQSGVINPSGMKNMNQSNITQYGQIVKKTSPDKMASKTEPELQNFLCKASDQGVTLEKKAPQKFSFSTCFADEGQDDEGECHNEVDTFNSIFDGIF